MTSNNDDKLAVVTDIRARVKKVKTPEYPTGTIIRFNHKNRAGKKLKYAALYASKRWWTTTINREGALRNINSIYSNDGFMELLGSAETTKIEVATEFESI